MKTRITPMVVFVLLGLGIASHAQASPPVAPPVSPSVSPPAKDCTRAREYVTTLEYLRSEKEFKIPEKSARTLAGKVAQGCSGAAKRFIEVTRLLSTSGLSADDSVESGLQFVHRTDAEVATFSAVFRRAFLEEYLNLDLRTSVKMAHSLSTEFDGDVVAVREDFQRLVDYCVEDKKVDLPRPQCAVFSARIARKGQSWKGGIARPFMKVFEFMLSSERDAGGPGLATHQALALAEKVVDSGPESVDNFIQGYRYAVADKGLELDSRNALTFAQQIAITPVPPGAEARTGGRQIASEKSPNK